MRLKLSLTKCCALIFVAVLLAEARGSANVYGQAAAPSRGEVLLVVGSSGPNDSDNAIRARLEGLGFSVQVVQDDALKGKRADGEALVFISSTVSSTKVGDAFRSVAVPTIVCEPNLFDDMDMTHGDASVDYGSKQDTELVVLTPKEALAAGLRGRFAVATQEVALGWGLPAKSALKIAAPNREAGEAHIFAYESGSKMISMAAPARRVGMFLTDNVAISLTDEGWRLFDAAVLWATGKQASPRK
jgi:hypothetical protein